METQQRTWHGRQAHHVPLLTIRAHVNSPSAPEPAERPSVLVPETPSPDSRQPDTGLIGFEPLRTEFLRNTDLPRLGSALMAVGWIHLGCFLVCQIIYTSGNRDSLPILAVWAVELLAVLGTMRWILGVGWRFQSTLMAMIFKIWVTFLILSFNMASLNKFTGFGIEWFKPAWVTLSTFVFMMLTFLFSPWFFLGAAQMYFTGLLMILLPAWTFGLYGLAWCVSLNVIGWTLIYRFGKNATQ